MSTHRVTRAPESVVLVFFDTNILSIKVLGIKVLGIKVLSVKVLGIKVLGRWDVLELGCLGSIVCLYHTALYVQATYRETALH